MKTHVQKRIDDIIAMRLTKRRTTKYIAQIRRRGWADCDAWGLNTHLARYMLPMLKHLFSHLHGYPCSLKSIKEWEEIGNKMIWSLERYAADDFFDLAYKATGYTPQSHDEKLRKKWYAEVKRLYKQAEDGMVLFAKYFGSLWD